MAHPTQSTFGDEKKTFTNGYLFGAPLKDLGIITTVIMGVGVGMAAFFLGTGVAIFCILFYNAAGHHADFTMAYRLVGLPLGAVVMACSLGYLGTFWVKRVFRKA